ncbi:hypothetical protein ACN4EG_23035 [Alkalinema pantanalense CENA528]|uniref:hypothetical protein n=1 Tax=Alkalinema pantanalense TaxID=1620705 RepID=UPI003D6EC705
MKNNVMIQLAVLVLSCFGVLTVQLAHAVPFDSRSYNGRFQHLPGHRGSTIEFQQVSGKLYVNFEGVEYFGEHGLGHYFYADYGQLMDAGAFSFEVPVRTFYSAPVRSGEFVTVRGQSRVPVRFSGKIEGDQLLVSCESEDESACFDQVMIFQRIK